MEPRIGNGGEPPSELGVQVREIQELAGQEKVLADIAERPLDLALGLGPVRLAGPRVEAVMRGEVDERAVVDDAAGATFAGHHGLHAVVEDLGRYSAHRRE